jgi:hypothetical protein
MIPEKFKVWEDVSLDVIDGLIKANSMMVEKIPLLKVDEVASERWREEIEASTKRLHEIRPSYEDGSEKSKSHRDTLIMLMACNLAQQFINLMEKQNVPAPQPDSAP